MNQFNINFLKNLQAQASVEPKTQGHTTPLEVILEEKKKTMQETQSQIPQLQREYVLIDGYRLPKDFFTCITYALIKLRNKHIDKVFDAFGFVMKDADNKPIYFKQSSKKSKKKNSRRK